MSSYPTEIARHFTLSCNHALLPWKMAIAFWYLTPKWLKLNNACQCGSENNLRVVSATWHTSSSKVSKWYCLCLHHYPLSPSIFKYVCFSYIHQHGTCIHEAMTFNNIDIKCTQVQLHLIHICTKRCSAADCSNESPVTAHTNMLTIVKWLIHNQWIWQMINMKSDILTVYFQCWTMMQVFTHKCYREKPDKS